MRLFPVLLFLPFCSSKQFSYCGQQEVASKRVGCEWSGESSTSPNTVKDDVSETASDRQITTTTTTTTVTTTTITTTVDRLTDSLETQKERHTMKRNPIGPLFEDIDIDKRTTEVPDRPTFEYGYTNNPDSMVRPLRRPIASLTCQYVSVNSTGTYALKSVNNNTYLSYAYANNTKSNWIFENRITKEAIDDLLEMPGRVKNEWVIDCIGEREVTFRTIRVDSPDKDYVFPYEYYLRDEDTLTAGAEPMRWRPFQNTDWSWSFLSDNNRWLRTDPSGAVTTVAHHDYNTSTSLENFWIEFYVQKYVDATPIDIDKRTTEVPDRSKTEDGEEINHDAIVTPQIGPLQSPIMHLTCKDVYVNGTSIHAITSVNHHTYLGYAYADFTESNLIFENRIIKKAKVEMSEMPARANYKWVIECIGIREVTIKTILVDSTDDDLVFPYEYYLRDEGGFFRGSVSVGAEPMRWRPYQNLDWSWSFWSDNYRWLSADPSGAVTTVAHRNYNTSTSWENFWFE